MNKTFAASDFERERQLRTYLTNRKNAVYSSLGTTVGELLVPDNIFLKVSDTFRLIPKLRCCIFYFGYQNQIFPEFSP